MKSNTTNVVIVVAFLVLCGAVAFFALSGGDPPAQTEGGDLSSSNGDKGDQGNREPPIPKDAIVIEYHTSKGKKGWVNEVTDTFNKAQHKIDGRPIVVKLDHMRSGSSLAGIQEGKIKPTLWSPVSESWIELLNETWQDRHKKKLITRFEPTVNVAMIVAMWEPMARALGWPDKPVGWEEIIKVSTDPKGWASLGHPEWGEFGFGHAHPDHSTSAMLSVISLLYAKAGKTSGLTSEDLKNPEVIKALEDVEATIVHYGKSSSWLTDKMCLRGPSYLSAVTLYESNVVSFNNSCADKAFPVVAIYPKEGTFWADHPTGIVEGDWVTPEMKEAAEKYLAYLLESDQQKLLPKHGFRPASDSVPLSAPFDQAHGVLPAMTKEKALDKPTKEVFKRANELWHKVKPKATVYILLDVSGSMRGKRINIARESTAAFIRHMNPDDEVQLLAFSHELNPLGDLGKVRDIGEGLVQKSNGLFANGNTRLYDAVAYGLKTIEAARKTRSERRIYSLVVLSDGADTGSQASQSDVLEMLPRIEDTHGTRVYSIAFAYGEGEQKAKDFLRAISERSNGAMQEGTLENMDTVYEAISAYF